MKQALNMMDIRRAAIDAYFDSPWPPEGNLPLVDIDLDAGRYLTLSRGADVPDDLVAAVVARVRRDDERPGAGVALVRGMGRLGDLDDRRRFHEALFRQVWAELRATLPETAGGTFRTKTGVTSDGAIPLELYGSAWSFKHLHMDRDALLFSHLYGPVSGFTGGALVLVDARFYLRRHGLRFADAFEWSDEPTEGSKPVLRAEHAERAVAEAGRVLSDPGPDEVLFVNNFPAAGILHGVTPVQVTDQAGFLRQFHRCSVKDDRLR